MTDAFSLVIKMMGNLLIIVFYSMDFLHCMFYGFLMS